MVRLLCNLQQKGLHTKKVLQDFSGFISLVTKPRSVLPTKKKKKNPSFFVFPVTAVVQEQLG